MNTKWHRETIEALGMMASLDRVVNKLNAVLAHSDDPKLRRMAETLIQELRRSTTSPKVAPAREQKIAVPTASVVLQYCRGIAYDS